MKERIRSFLGPEDNFFAMINTTADNGFFGDCWYRINPVGE